MKKLLILLLLVPSLSWGEHKNESEKMEFSEISDNLLMCFAYYEMTRDALSRTSEDHSDAIKKINDIQALMLATINDLKPISHISDEVVSAKLQLMVKVIMEEIDYDYSNLSIAIMNYGDNCRLLSKELIQSAY